jgi:4-hydroxythreonine-4-phosphate dehydrogenase
MNPITLVITPGDPNGIGPEVTKKALNFLWKELKTIKVVVYSKKFPVHKSTNIEFITPLKNKPTGEQVGWAIEQATQLVNQSNKNHALITGPINKLSFQNSGYNFKGHTDFLASLTKSKNVTMVLANDWFRVGLVTNHCSIKDVPKNITVKKIVTTIEQAAKFCREHLGKKCPNIAVLGLNPHAGENGILGSEESRFIIPAMEQVIENSKKLGLKIKLSGPHPADSFFAVEKENVKKNKGHDFIIAQYHDQGLIPVKLSDFSNGLNLTLGLPFIRTSVDHGTAFDIAGKNKADPGSMIYAIRKAIEYL